MMYYTANKGQPNFQVDRIILKGVEIEYSLADFDYLFVKIISHSRSGSLKIDVVLEGLKTHFTFHTPLPNNSGCHQKECIDG